jgi:hypothetical protein
MMAMNLRKNSRFFSQLLDINSLFVPKIHSTAQHSTAQHYNSARNNFSGYSYFKSNSQSNQMVATFSNWKTARGVGQIMSYIMGFSYFKPF